MNSKNLIPGVILVIVGLLFLSRNFGWFDFRFSDFAQFWPLLFVAIGINIIWGKQRGVTIALVVLLALCIPVIIAGKVRDKVRSEGGWNGNGLSYSFDDEDEDNDSDHQDTDEDMDNRGGGKQYLSEPMNENVNAASFKLEGGAAKFTMGTTEKELIEADGNLSFGNLFLKSTVDNGENQVSLKMSGKGNWKFNENTHNDVAIRLNPKPVWSLNMQVGAGKLDFDLTPFTVQKLKLETGAAEMDLKLGDKADLVDVDVQAGMASVTFEVPQSVGCRIETDGALTDKQFDGFTKNGDTYETPGYASAKKKINIRFSGGISEWKVERY